MIRQHKWKAIISSVLILLPSLVGMLLYDKLPAKIATHWGIDGQVDGWTSAFVAVTILPLILLAVHWLCLFITSKDKKQQAQSRKAIGMVFWIMPGTSFFVSGIMYASAFGLKMDITNYLFVFLGLMFMVIGNYMPKCKQNSTLGIKIKWTLANEENWNATHRFTGKVWFIGGILFMIAALLPAKFFVYAMIPSIAVLVLPPLVYSYLYYKKQLASGSATKEDFNPPKTKAQKIITIVSLILVVAILVFCGAICFTGNIEVHYGDADFTIEATYWDDVTVKYADIESIEYRESGYQSVRVIGFGTPRLMLGGFQNEEQGDHTRYSYTNCEAIVILKVNGKYLAINISDAAQTKAVYNELKTRSGL